jgi:hypothetical protein
MDELDADIERMYRRIGGVPVRLWTEIKGHLDATVRFYNKYQRRLPTPLLAAYRTAFFIARAFFTARRSVLEIPADVFERDCGSNSARIVREFITCGGTWLRIARQPVQGEQASVYRLLLGPKRPGEPCLVLPP